MMSISGHVMWSCDTHTQVQHATTSKANQRLPGSGAGVGVVSNQNRSATIQDPRRAKAAGGGAETNISRASRFASLRRAAAKSPSPPPTDVADLLDEEGLVISNNRHDSLVNFLEDDDEDSASLDNAEADTVMEDLKKEEEETLSFLIDRRLLHKDFIVDKFRLALVYFRKVSLLFCCIHG